MNTFHYTSYAQEVIFGSGSLAHLSEAVDRFHRHRLIRGSTGSLRRDGTIATLERALGRAAFAFLTLQPDGTGMAFDKFCGNVET